jgi:SAM-dependent methyltransferase
MKKTPSTLQNLRNPVWNHLYLHYKYLFRDLKRVISQYAGGNVLDVGCGNKPYKQLFKNNISYVGCDVVQSSGQEVDVICPATALDFGDNYFDTVFSTQVLEHVNDHRKAISEVRRVLKPGGYFIFSVPFAWELHMEPHDYMRFSKYGIRFLQKTYNFKELELAANGGKWAAIGQLKLSILLTRFRKYPGIRTANKLFINYMGIKLLMNLYYSLMDKIDYDETFTLNYVVVWQKPVE